MSKVTRSGLGSALAERVQSLSRANARLRAVEDSRESEAHVVGEPDSETVLRRALQALSSHQGYDSARRILAGEPVNAVDELAKAGLVTWNPVSDSMRATALLIELMRVFESAVDEARQEP
jgi:hypothetical protein